MSDPARAPAVSATPSALETFLDRRGWRLAPFQREVVDAYRAGESGLVHSATGSGKTLAAWLGPLTEALDEGTVREPPVRVIWVTPLKALATDLTANLRAIAGELGLDWRIEQRTGDTGSGSRARQRRRLPSALVTTPESLALLLSYPETVAQLAGVCAVVVDEWHELLGSKRGVLLELVLTRLRTKAPALRIWGLSATLGNLETALAALLGPDRPGRLVASGIRRDVAVRSLIPAAVERFPWAGHIGLKLLDEVAAAIAEARSTLVFCNTRYQAEAWYEALLRHRLDWIDAIALHHGSLDASLRRRVEALLRDGALKCVVATSSLDLGVDFSPVEQVIQVGGPKGVARLLQRAGRSGHAPGRASVILGAPAHALELLEFAAARRAAAEGRIEPRSPSIGSLDVLAQHVVTAVLGEPLTPDALLAEARSSHAFAALTQAEWSWVLDFLTRGGPALHAYPEYRRLETDAAGRLQVATTRVARRHRMTVGTITSDAVMDVQWLGGGRLGTVEESFLARLDPGDRFQFAGRNLELVRIREMTAYVRRAPGAGRTSPRWMGGRMPLSSELAEGVLALIEGFAEGRAEEPEVQALAPLLTVQARWSALPGRDRLLVEQIRSREGHHLFLYPFAGRLVHEGLAALLAWRLGQRQPATFSTAVDDYGLELLSATPLEVDEGTLRAITTPEGLVEDVLACSNAAEMARRRFREIARISGLVFPGYPGGGKTQRQLQASAGLVFDVLERHDADNLLLAQARNEVLERELEASRLEQALRRVREQTLVATRPERLTPLAFPLWAQRLRSRVSTETWETRVARMLDRLERAAG